MRRQRSNDSLISRKKQSPGLSETADPKIEIPLFKERKLTQDHFTLVEIAIEKEITDSKGKQKSDEVLVEDLEQRWDKPPLNLHEDPATVRTLSDRWTIKLTKTTITKPSKDDDLDESELENLKGVWFESKDGTPIFQQFGSGGLSIGSKAGDSDVWQINADGIEEVHCNVHLNQTKEDKEGEQIPNLDKVEVEHVASEEGATTRVGKKELTKFGEKVIVKLPTEISIGKGKIKLRRGKVFKMKFSATRTFLHRRRDMKEFDEKTDYSKRRLVPIDLNDDQLFETAN